MKFCMKIELDDGTKVLASSSTIYSDIEESRNIMGQIYQTGKILEDLFKKHIKIINVWESEDLNVKGNSKQ